MVRDYPMCSIDTSNHYHGEFHRRASHVPIRPEEEKETFLEWQLHCALSPDSSGPCGAGLCADAAVPLGNNDTTRSSPILYPAFSTRHTNRTTVVGIVGYSPPLQQQQSPNTECCGWQPSLEFSGVCAGGPSHPRRCPDDPLEAFVLVGVQ